jgi:DNA mismatch repair protein MutL
MKDVRELPSHLINQIAAGEVVERPASVVKELVENALDAGARRIEVTVVEGGTEKIEVADDGHGMRPQDARLAILRHATSKIANIEDLERLSSFGFRGEALPSIAAVSRFELVTRTVEAQAALALRSEGSNAWQESPASAPVGTRVSVRDLFFNIPARRKFLKSVATESAAISEVLLGQALAAPSVSFTLTRDGKRVREYLHAPSRHDRAASALPNEPLSPFRFERGSLRVEAFLSHPERARVGAQGLHLIVNRRAVRDRALARAIAFAYGSVLTGGKYPIGVLYLDLPDETVDVNVHPQKLEVRFRDARSVFDAITRELSAGLAKTFATPAVTYRAAPPPFLPSEPTHTSNVALPVQGATTASEVDEPSLFRSVQFYASLSFRAQVRSTFLLCEGRDALYVIDQHAAHERVLFDKLKRQRGKVPVQKLLHSHVLEVGEDTAAMVEAQEPAFLALGFELRRVGPISIALSALPADLPHARLDPLLRALLDEVSGMTRGFSEKTDLIYATLACHAAIRAGDAVHAAQADALLKALDAVDFSGYCPHGRPVLTRIGFDELERKVGR